MSTDKVEVVEGSDNVFADLGLPDAEDLLLKSAMVIKLRRLIDGRNLSQTSAAELLGIGQANLSKLLRGQFRGYSVDRLMRMLTAFDQDVEIVTRPHARADALGRVSFRSI